MAALPRFGAISLLALILRTVHAAGVRHEDGGAFCIERDSGSRGARRGGRSVVFPCSVGTDAFPRLEIQFQRGGGAEEVSVDLLSSELSLALVLRRRDRPNLRPTALAALFLDRGTLSPGDWLPRNGQALLETDQACCIDQQGGEGGPGEPAPAGVCLARRALELGMPTCEGSRLRTSLAEPHQPTCMAGDRGPAWLSALPGPLRPGAVLDLLARSRILLVTAGLAFCLRAWARRPAAAAPKSKAADVQRGVERLIRALEAPGRRAGLRKRRALSRAAPHVGAASKGEGIEAEGGERGPAGAES